MKNRLIAAPAVVLVLSTLTVASTAWAEQSSVTERHAAAYVPARVQVTDPPGDATYGQRLPRQPSDAADVMEAWYTAEGETITGHMHLMGNPLELQDTPFDLNVQLRSNPSLDAEIGCLAFAASFPGATGTGPGPIAVFADVCEDASFYHPATLDVQDQGDGTVILSITVSRSASPFFAPGRRLTKPHVMTRHTTEPFHRHVAYFDRTDEGSTYRLPHDLSRPAKPRKGCKPASDWFYGVEGPVTRISDAATEENPVEINFVHEPAAGALLVRQLADIKYFPIHVVTKDRSHALHIRLEWGTPSVDEIDLFLQANDGEYVAWDDGTNVPLPLQDEDYPEGAGLSGMGYEYIAGHPVGNCEGFVVQSEALRSVGRDVTLKMWLGEASPP